MERLTHKALLFACALLAGMMACGSQAEFLPIIAGELGTTGFLDDIGSAQRAGSTWVVKSGAPVEFDGWAADHAKGGQLPELVQVVLLDGTGQARIVASIKPALPRPDVATSHKQPAILNCGFKVTYVPAGQLAGEHEVYLVSRFKEKISVLRTGKRLKVE